MESREHIIEEFLQYDRFAVPAVVEQWLPEERIRQLLRQEWERNARLIDDIAFAESFAAGCPVEGAVAADYNYRMLSLNDGHALTSIRFKGLDLQKPFVDILHRDFAIESPAHVQSVAREVAQQYELFSPRSIRVFDTSGRFDQQKNASFISCDFRYYAAPIHVLRQLPEPPRFDEISLDPLTTLDFYDDYAAMYQRFYSDSPHLCFVPLESRETITHYLNKGSLYRIVIDGQFAGVVGVMPQQERFLSGYLVVEEILDRPFRRQGFAAALQRRLLEVLDDSNNNVLYGHISPLNTPSLRTAAKVGRHDVGGVYFVDTGTGASHV